MGEIIFLIYVCLLHMANVNGVVFLKILAHFHSDVRARRIFRGVVLIIITVRVLRTVTVTFNLDA